MRTKIKKMFKSIMSGLLAFSMVAGSMVSVNAEESSADLIAKYDFENVSGTTVPNEAEGAAGFDGILSGTNVSIEENTVFGSSLKFTEGTEGHMLVENIVNTGTTSYSISMWYQYDTSVNRGTKKTVLLQQSDTGRTLLTLTPENQYHTYVNATAIYTEGTVSAGNWQHITWVYDSENQKVKFYINGELDSEQSAGTNEVDAVTDLLIGRHKNGGSDPLSMRGLVDEICIYEGVVTDAKALAIYEEKAGLLDGNTNFEDALLAYYDFENVSGTTVPNEAEGATEFDGTLNGSNVSIQEETALGSSLNFAEGTEGHMLVENIVNTGTTSYSISMWYRFDASVNRGSKNVVLLQQSDGGRSLLMLSSANKYSSYVNATTVTSTGTVNVGDWQHITYVYDSENQLVKFYINGVLDSSQSAGTSEVDAFTNLIIGRHKSSGTDPLTMKGLVDEIYIYETVIDDAKAKSLYEEKASEIKDYELSVPIVLTIDPAVVERELGEGIFGINHRYAFNAYGSFNPETMKVRENFQEIYEEIGFGSIRYPGGSISNVFNWKTTLDAVGRKKQIHAYYNNSGQAGIEANFGVKEIGDFVDDVGSEIVYVYGIGRGNAQDAADLVEYMNAEVGTNPNGGIDWAAVRSEAGHPEPYNVRYFEIGNETQQVYVEGTTSQGYWLHGVSNVNRAFALGDTATFTKQYAVCEEDWNSVASKSDGSANLVRYMRYANVNPKTYDENGNIVDDKTFQAINTEGVEVYVGDVQWTIVDNFDDSSAEDTHVVIDYSIGAILFGDGVHGAIPATGTQIYVSYSVERDGFVDISRAIRETTEKINEANEANGIEKQHEAYVYAGFENTAFITVMANNGYNDLYDGIAVHPYSGAPSGSGEAFYDDTMARAESAGLARVQTYVDALPEGKVPVISEYGVGRSTNALVRSQTQAIYIGKVIMEYIRMGSPYIQKHCLVDWYSSGADALGATQQAVIQAVAQDGANTKTGEGDFEFFATPSARVFQMFNSCFGDEVIASEFSVMQTVANGTTAYNGLASKDADGNYYVALVNTDRENGRNIEVAVSGEDVTGRELTVLTLASESFADENTLEEPDKVAIETNITESTESTVMVEVPKHSFVIVKIAAEAAEEPPVETTPVTEIFVDVAEGAWYVDSVQYVYDEGIIIGDGNVFAPDEATTRAMVAVILYRLAGSPEITDYTEYNKFTDLPTEHLWYSDAVAWALKEKVSTGDDANMLYNPTSSVTREQLALFLWRYAKYNNEDVTANRTEEELFGGTYVNDWAKEGFLWAVDKGIIRGAESIGADGQIQYDLLPQGGATRAQLARMLHRYLGGISE